MGNKTGHPLMIASELELYVHAHIPLSKAMGVSVVRSNEHEVLLRAPLEPNINHRETVFGGSASAVAILAAWALLFTRMKTHGLDQRLVIQRNTMYYDAPICGPFTARASLATVEHWDWFLQMVRRKGKGRVSARSVLEFEGRTVGRCDGEFVALKAT